MSWRSIRKKTDPSTKNLLITIERIRRRYEKESDSLVFRLTDKVRPWTEEEIMDGVKKVLNLLAFLAQKSTNADQNFWRETQGLGRADGRGKHCFTRAKEDKC